MNSSNPSNPVYAGNISVTINGLPAQVTQTLGSPQQGTWSLDDPAYTLVPTAGDFTIQIHYAGPPNLQTISDPAPIHWKVYSVVPYTIPGINNDWVNTHSPLLYLVAPPDSSGFTNNVLTTRTLTSRARVISNGFTITAPDQNGFYGIDVGIIQTVTAGTAVNNVIYSNHANLAETIPMYCKLKGGPNYNDAASPYSSTPYYSDSSVKFVNTWNGLTTNTYGPGSPYLKLEDSPSMNLAHLIGYNGKQWDWGIIDPVAQTESLNGTPYFIRCEDMLVAHHYFVPSVYVPIYGYRTWHATFNGFLNFANSSNVFWTGGEVGDEGTGNSNMPELAMGPFNTKIQTSWTPIP